MTADPARDTAAFAKLKAKHARAVDAAEFHPDGLVAVDANGVIDFVNARAARITGIPVESLEGRALAEALPFQDLDGMTWWEFVDPWRTLAIVTGHRERTLLLPNGHLVLVTARYLRNPDGSILAVVLGLRDAAGRMRAERKMADTLTTVAHELRSPIAGITGFSASLLQHWDRLGDDDKQTMLRMIQGDAERVTRLISELLDVSRIDAHSLRIRPRPVDLAEMVRAHVSRQVASGESHERFEVLIAPDLPHLWADRDRLEQVVTNLVENALRHGAGNVCLQVQPDELADGQPGVRLSVLDEGDGIPEENRELVFSRNWHGAARSGTGLGLYLVRGLVEAHGGRVRIGDSPSGGALIDVVLPTGGVSPDGSWTPGDPHSRGHAGHGEPAL